MIVAQKWYCIAQTTSIGSSSGIKVEFGNYYRLLLNASVDWGNAVISIQFSNISKDIVASVRLRNNGQYFYLDIKLSEPFDTDFSTSLYDNSSWNLASSVSDLSGVPICIIDDINSLNTSQTGGESYFVEDENGDLHPIPKKDGTARGIYTDSYLSSGGKNPNAGGGGGGGITDLLIRFDNISPNPNGYQVVNGVITLPNYPVVPDISNYLTKSQADEAYYPLASGNALDSRLSVIEKAFDITIDENGIVQEIKANAGFWTEHYLSSGGKNEDGGSTGGLAQVTIRFDAEQIQEEYVSEDGIIHLPAYPKLSDLDLSAYLTKLDAAELYYSKVKGNELEATVTGINTALTQFRTLFDSMFEIDEDGHIKAKKGLYTEQFLSSGGKNEDINSGGGISSFIIKLGEDEYALENGVVSLPAYPDVSGFILKTTADILYQPKGNYLTSIPSEYITETELSNALSPYLLSQTAADTYATTATLNEHIEDYTAFKTTTNERLQSLEDMFEWDDDGHIHAKAGLYTDSFLSSGGKNTTEGTTGGGLTEFSVIFNGTQYDSSNGVATIDGTYATSDAVNDAIATSNSYTDTSIANLINGAPSTLDTLKEIADAMDANKDVVDALEEAIGTKASQTELNTLSVRVTTAENDIKTLQTNVSTNAAAINTNKTAIGTLQGYFTNGIANEAAKVSNIFKIIFNGTTYEYNGSAAKEINFSAANIVSALGTTPVNRAKGDENGNNIKSTYATKTALQEFIDKIEKYFTFGEDNIKANYGLWTDSYLSAGGQNTEGGSGGGGITAFDIMFEGNNVDKYSLENGKVILPAYPTTLPASDVSDWAKKSSLAASDVPNLSWNKITSDKPTTLAGYGITDFILNTTSSLNNVTTKAGIYRVGPAAPDSAGYGNAITLRYPTSDTYGQLYIPYYMATQKSGVYWRGATSDNTTQSWRLMLDESNYSSYALPLSGGTIEGSWNALKINSTDENQSVTLHLQLNAANKAYFGYNATNGAFIYNYSGGGFIGIKDDGTPHYKGTYTLIHSGNYSDYALPLSGGTMANNAGIKWSNNVHSWNEPVDGFECISTTNNTLGYYSGLSYKGYYGLQIRVYGGNTDDVQVRGYNSSVWGTWRTIIHSGNIKDYNAGSATKLSDNTARTIWGQTFFENGIPKSVSGNISGNYFHIEDRASNPYYKLIDSDGQLGYFQLLPYNKGVAIGSTSSLSLVVSPSGYVGIGSKSPQYKLDVYGNARFGTGSGCDIWLNRTSGNSYIHVVDSLAFTTGNKGSTNIALELKADLSAKFYGNISASGAITATGNITSSGDIIAYSSSDARLKENITTISDDRAIDILSRLNPVTFAWNEIATSLSSRLQGDSQGFIAQEWEKIIPNASGTMWGKYKGIDYIQTIPYLTKGWQIHETKIQRLEREVKELKDKLAKYESIS